VEQCAAVLRQRQLPRDVRKGSGSFDPLADTIEVMTVHVSKGLEFPVVALTAVSSAPYER